MPFTCSEDVSKRSTSSGSLQAVKVLKEHLTDELRLNRARERLSSLRNLLVLD